MPPELALATSPPAVSRWARLGPYYAMFPVNFAENIVNKYTRAGDSILDPFAGRGTSAYAAAALGRKGVGVEINPVGWVYGKAKIAPASKQKVIARLDEICAAASRFGKGADALPPFFHACYSRDVRKFLLAARAKLNWQRSAADTTLMAFVALHLHGKNGEGMSNQMRQTKAMSPEYSLRWWKARGMTPPDINPADFLLRKIEWRYAKGVPEFGANARLYLGDSENILTKIKQQHGANNKKFALLFTSPPYWSLVNYHADQWLRLWLMGGADSPKNIREKNKGRFVSQPAYRALLFSVFAKCAKVMSKRAIVYVRTDIRQFTRDTTREALKECFPGYRMREEETYVERTQSHLFKNIPSIASPGEVDIIMHPLKIRRA